MLARRKEEAQPIRTIHHPASRSSPGPATCEPLSRCEMGNMVSTTVHASSKVISAVSKYCVDSVGALLALRLLVVTFCTEHHLEEILTDKEDKETYKALKEAMHLFIADLHAFVKTVGGKLRLVVARILDAEKYPHLEACYGGFSADDALRDVTKLHATCVKLRSDFSVFKVDLEMKYPTAKARRLISAWFNAAFALTCIAAIAATFIPGVNLAIPLIGLVSLGAGAVVSTMAAVVLFVSKTQREVAISFLANMETRLHQLRNHIAEVRADTTLLSGADRAEAVPLLNKIITECDAMDKLCKLV